MISSILIGLVVIVLAFCLAYLIGRYILKDGEDPISGGFMVMFLFIGGLGLCWVFGAVIKGIFF